MILNEITTVPSAAIPVAAFAEHLHLGSGFADDGAQDGVLETYLRAALSAIEARSGLALFQRSFSWALHSWSNTNAQRVPVSPVQSIQSMRLISAAGAESLVNPDHYQLRKDGRQVRIMATGVSLPHLPHNGSVEIVLEAGFGPAWEDIPADLRQSVLMLAAHHYEHRTGQDAGAFPAGVLALLEPYRAIRLSGGAA